MVLKTVGGGEEIGVGTKDRQSSVLILGLKGSPMKHKCDKSVGFEFFSFLGIYFWQENLLRDYFVSQQVTEAE